HKYHVLCPDARSGPSVEDDTHRLGLAFPARLGRKGLQQIRGADADCICAEGTVRRCVRIVADHDRAGLYQPELRSDDMNDALARMGHSKALESVRAVVALKRCDDFPVLVVAYGSESRIAIDRRHVVI